MGMLMDMTVRDFNNILASSAPAPGGGSTAALAGVLGSALTMMVVNLTVGKKSYQALDETIKHKIIMDYETIKILNKELTELVDEDTKAFNLVMEAMKLPKETEEDRIRRTDRIQKASRYALKVPLMAAEKCLLILQHQINIALYGNINAVSDIGVGAVMAFSGLESAVLNVKINIPAISDQAIKMDAIQKIRNYLTEGDKIKTEIVATVNSRIGDG